MTMDDNRDQSGSNQELISHHLVLICEYPEFYKAAATHKILSKAQSLQLAQIVSESLQKFYSGIENLNFVLSGAIYDLGDVLQANFLVHSCIEESGRKLIKDNHLSAQIIALGANDQNHFSVAPLNPRDQFSAPLALIPFVLLGNADEMKVLSEDLENNLMQQEIDQTSQMAIQSLFNQHFPNISFATLADTCGFLAAQLIQIGLEPLWKILQAAFFNDEESHLVMLNTGHRILWHDQQVYVFNFSRNNWSLIEKKLGEMDIFQNILQRFIGLFTQHQIPHRQIIVSDDQFFNNTVTLQMAINKAEQHIVQL